jgi:hypothetical protein
LLPPYLWARLKNKSAQRARKRADYVAHLFRQISIAPQSRKILLKLLEIHPQETQQILKYIKLFKPDKVIFSSELANAKNPTLLRGLAAEPSRLLEITEEVVVGGKAQKVMDFRKAGINRVHKVNDRTLPSDPESLASEVDAILNNLPELRQRRELAYLSLFSAVSRALAELYIWGEEEDAPKDVPSSVYAQKKSELACHLQTLSFFFPFTRDEVGQDFKKTIESSSSKIIGPFLQFAARSELVALRERIDAHLIELENARQNRELRELDSNQRNFETWIARKVRKLGPGKFKLFRAGYRKSAGGIVHMDLIPAMTRTTLILSENQHKIESCEEELATLDKLTEDIEAIHDAPILLEHWHRLYEIYESLRRVRKRSKSKAKIKLQVVLTVSRIGTERADRLAKSILHTTLKDLNRRKRNLEEIIKRATHTRETVKEYLEAMVDQFSWDIAYRDLKIATILSNPMVLKTIREKIEKFLNQTLEGEPREEFLVMVKQKLESAKESIERALEKSEKKQLLFRATQGYRQEMKKGEAKGLKDKVVGLLQEIKALNGEIAEHLIEAADSLVLVKNEISNINSNLSPNQREKSRQDFLGGHKGLRNAIRGHNENYVDIYNDKGELVAKQIILITDAKEHGFRT